MIKRFSDWLSNRKQQFENFLKTGELEAVESMVDQLADPNKFPPGRTLYDTLVGWGVGTSINTHDGVFFKAGFEQPMKTQPMRNRLRLAISLAHRELQFD